jgi:hypothetical protein
MGTKEKGFCLQPDLVSCIFSVLYLLSVVRSVIGCWCCLSVVSAGASVVIVVGCRLSGVDCKLSGVAVDGCRWFLVVGCWISCVGC